ncbi:MAG TPA: condensation domain-containing protein [Baekduia sp.]|jgi:non-ribosomal peptide synthetase component F
MTVTEGAEAAPLSVAQEALWYASLLAPNRISYNETVSIRKDGPFDVAAFRRAFDEIVARHEIWRTTFDRVGGVPVQVVAPPSHFDLPLVDLSGLTQEEAEHAAVRLVAETSRVPYDVRRGPLVRPRLIRFPGEHHRLYLALHHVIFDGVSVYRVVLREVIALYDAFAAGEPSPLAAPQAQYADYARWEQEWIAKPRVARRFEHWRERLTPLPALSMPFDHPRPAEPRYRGGVLALSVPREAVDRLRVVGQGAGASLFQVLATTWSLLLGRYSGQDDVVFGTAADMRQRPEFESVVGYCLTPLVMRVDLSGDLPFADLVVRVRNELLDGLDHLVPFERLVRELQPEQPGGGNPIYQTMLVLEPTTAAPDPAWSLHQMEGEIGDAVGTTKLDLELELDERPNGHLAGRLIYDTDLFEPATAARIAEHWSRLVEAVAADPTLTASQIPLLTEAEEHRQLVEWNATATDLPPGGVHERVAARWAAVSAGGQAVDAAELDARAATIARRLRAAGVVPGDVVACCAPPSIDLIAGALGVLQAGAAHLLLDPDLPVDQLDFLIADSGATALLAAPGLAATLTSPPARVLVLGEDGPEEDLAAEPAAPDAVCCVQYTDDPPRAVPLRHAAVVNVATALATDLSLVPADTVLVLPPALYATPVLDLWLPLLAGARIVVAPAEAAADGAQLSRFIKAEGVSFLHASPATWQTLIDTGLKPARSLRGLCSGGPLSPALADAILARCRILWNAYGTAETTEVATLGRVERAQPVTLGRPIANTRAYVLDGAGRPAAVGVPGDLVIAGEGIAGAFVDDPFAPGRAHRTGDRARWLPDGRLQAV